MTERIAIYGGSFDPPHHGHVLAVAWALSSGEVDVVWVFPVARHRFGKRPSSFPARMAMCEAAFSIYGRRARVRSDEQRLVAAGGSGATIELVEALLADEGAARGKRTFRLLIGADQLPALARWARWTELEALAPPLVVGRRGHAGGSVLAIPDVSSTEVRRRLDAGEPITELVPARVAALLESPRKGRENA